LVMETFMYVLSVEKPFSEEDLPRVTEEICRFFKCTGISVSGGNNFTVHSPLRLDQLDGQVNELSRRFGAQFKAGGKVQ